MSNVLHRRLHHHRIWSAIGWGFVLLVVYLSLMRAPTEIAPKVFDIGHVVAYAWLMLWFAQLHRPTGVRLIVGAFLCALGAAIEFAQGLTGYRTFDYADMVMNTLGVIIGLLLARTPLQHALEAVERRFLA